MTVFLFAMMPVSADDGPALKEIMQGLLADSNEIIEGLLIEDFDKVSRGAARISNHPQIPQKQVELVARELGAEMPVFKEYDTRVHDLSLSIAAAAGEGDRNRAIADYHQMLDGCFACHNAYKGRVAAILSAEFKSE
jgi:hypothetical protein